MVIILKSLNTARRRENVLNDHRRKIVSWFDLGRLEKLWQNGNCQMRLARPPKMRVPSRVVSSQRNTLMAARSFGFKSTLKRPAICRDKQPAATRVSTHILRNSHIRRRAAIERRQCIITSRLSPRGGRVLSDLVRRSRILSCWICSSRVID